MSRLDETRKEGLGDSLGGSDPDGSSGAAAPLLTVEHLTLQYGQLRAVNDVSLTIARGARHALIGPNGAGKSSLFSVLAGSTRATSGAVDFDGHDITGESEVERARRGMVRTYQHANLFVAMTVLENVAVAVERAAGRPLRPWPSRTDRRIRAAAAEYVARVGLADRVNDRVDALSHGERRQLEVAMVLACEPSLILFDEPTAGMSAAETARFGDLVESLPDSVTTVIIEHDLDIVFRLAHRVSVLAAGVLIAEGTPEEVRADTAVHEAYLGVDRNDDPLFEVAS